MKSLIVFLGLSLSVASFSADKCAGVYTAAYNECIAGLNSLGSGSAETAAKICDKYACGKEADCRSKGSLGVVIDLETFEQFFSLGNAASH